MIPDDPSLRSLRQRLRARYREASAGARTLPDFLILGAQKAGTTSLHRYLEQHPAVVPSLLKEVHYFDLQWWRGERWYRSHFPTTLRRRVGRLLHGRPVLSGEASPYYLPHPLAPQRVRATVPDARLVVLLRDPVARAHSHFHHNRRFGVEDLPTLAEAVEREPQRLAGELERILADERYESFAHRNHSYLLRGVYVEQLRAWLELFPREQLLVLETGELDRDTSGAYGRVLDFLGLPPWQPPAFGRHNPSGSPPLDPALRARLAAWFEPHNRALYQLLGRDLGWERPR
jgi:hypothetical protein